ncbi:HepT-like ribonuclease domain-containing protein, partial [Arthrospira platensis SPKY2]
MLDAAQKAVAFVDGRERSDLESDEMLSLAIVRLLEIIGEAAARLSDETKAMHPAIPWQEITGTRNR